MKRFATILFLFVIFSFVGHTFAQQAVTTQVLKPVSMKPRSAPIPFVSPKSYLNLAGKNNIQGIETEAIAYDTGIDPNDNTTFLGMELPYYNNSDGAGTYALGERFTGVKVKNYTVDSFYVTIAAHSFGTNPGDRLLFTLRKKGVFTGNPNIFPAFTFVDSTQLLPTEIPSDDMYHTYVLHFDKKVKTKFTTSSPDFFIFAELPIADTTGNSLFVLADAVTDDPANHAPPFPDGDRFYAYFSRNDSTFVTYYGGHFQRTSDQAVFYNQLAITAFVSGTSLGVEDGKLAGNALGQNYPNPFNPSTEINYSLADASQVSLKVFNTLGVEVATIVNEREEAGSHQANFAGDNLPSGTYFYTLKAGTFSQTKRMVLSK